MYQKPTFFGVAYASHLFRVLGGRALHELREATAGAPDLEIDDHMSELLRWLNKWGCRITEGEFPTISPLLRDWYRRWMRTEKLPKGELRNLQDDELDLLAAAHGDLLKIREFGPTSASKTLFVVCPHASIPWDIPIRKKLKSLTKQLTYRAMLEWSREEAGDLIADAGRCGFSSSRQVLRYIENGAGSITELLDQYHWVTITRGHRVPSSDELRQWVKWATREGGLNQ